MQYKVVIKSARTGQVLWEAMRPAKSALQAQNWVRRYLFGTKSFAALEQDGYVFETAEVLPPRPSTSFRQPAFARQLLFSFCNQSESLAAFTR